MYSTIQTLIIVTISLGVGVSADFWDDFSNNLATDLAPVISLFGEQVTKQYLSESTTLLDYIIFATAPIGVITAIVSAVRVSGSPSLRAFVGRAKEGQGNVEAELLSSTSRDVCELYNNGGIARVIGRPKILEFVHDPDAPYAAFQRPHGTAGITTFEEYCETENGRQEWIRTLRQYTKSERTIIDGEHESLVWVAVATTVIGFIVQFVGFRGIHSAVSVAQLGAALVMTIARAGLRARRLDDLGSKILWGFFEERNYELDWLALHLGKEDIEKDLGLDMCDPHSVLSRRNHYYSWVVHGVADIGERILECSPHSSHNPGIADNLDTVEKIVAYRRRLGELTDPNQGERDMSYLQWGTENVEVRGTATKLTSAIQSATTKVFMSSPILKKRWKPVSHIKIAAKCGVGLGYDHRDFGLSFDALKPLGRIYLSSPELKGHKLLSMVRNGEDQWEIEDRHELEAALGLWSWSLNRHQRKGFGGRLRGTFNRRILCWDNSPSDLGWQYWAEESKPRENRISRPDISWSPRTIWLTESLKDQNANKFVPSTLSQYPDTEVLTQLFGWYSGEPSLLPADMQDMPIWTLPTDSTFLSLCMQEIFGVCVKSLLETMEDTGVVSVRETPTGPRLESQLVSDLVDILLETGLVSRDDAISCLLPIVVFEEFKSNRTPLWHAARAGHVAMVTELIQTMQDDEDLQDGKGRSPLWQAAANGHDVVVGLLLAHGADRSSRDDTGRTPLIEATANGHRNVVQLLLEWGLTDLDTQDNKGQTALSHAAAQGHEAIAGLLLDVGADAKALDSAGFTPLSRAVDAGHVGIVKLIRMAVHDDSTRLINDYSVFNIDEATFIRSSLGTEKAINTSQIQPWRQAIQIAILTANIEPTDPKSKGKGNKERVHWKDWVNDGSEIDSCDHSTILADLALLYGPQAEVYVARVPEPSVDPDQATSTICEAIEWALESWIVDIIVLPPWLPSKNKDLRLTIHKAHKQGKILMAAAESSSFEGRRSHPASSPYVIGIHAVDGRGKDCGVSPIPVKGNYNFSTLGIAIERPGLADESHEPRYVSGAIYSAVIAASTAATLLEFSRFNLKIDHQEDQEWICSTEGIREMLRLTSANIDGYNYIAPWTLIGSKSNLEDICDIIMMVVRKEKTGFGKAIRSP
ncbi:ankyrin repeat domain-containing protein 28 [Fusarium avenaceum]|nr:ankyrin repeat domain-containing protein 28 [Fusarium avenaceum]